MKLRTSILFTVTICILLGMGLCITGCAEEKGSNSAVGTVVEEGVYHRLYVADQLYYCEFLDHSGNVVRTEGPINKQPEILALEDGLIRFTMQAGTGQATQWGYFYNTENEAFSEVFQCIWDQHEGLVAISQNNSVIVRDIFDPQEFYQEFTAFDQPFSPAAQVFTAVRFTEDGVSIEITYLSGTDYREVTETFPIETTH